MGVQLLLDIVYVFLRYVLRQIKVLVRLPQKLDYLKCMIFFVLALFGFEKMDSQV